MAGVPAPNSQIRLRGTPARLERDRPPRGCEGSTPGLPGPDRGEQPPERRRCAVGGAGNVYGGPLGEPRSRGGPLPDSGTPLLEFAPRPPPGHLRPDWLPLLGAAGPGATSRGAGGGLRPRGARSSAPCPRRKGRATARRHLRSRVTFPALPRPPHQAFLRVPITRALSRSPRLSSVLTNRSLWLSPLGCALATCKSLVSRHIHGRVMEKGSGSPEPGGGSQELGTGNRSRRSDPGKEC